MDEAEPEITPARGDEMPLVRALFEEYATEIEVDLCFQGFDEELATLPGEYVYPHEELLVARRASALIGCVALRKLDDETCEMKRLYLRSAYRGARFGHCLADAMIRKARLVGYRRMRLDTLPTMMKAIELYGSLGFQSIEPYRINPVAGALFLELVL